MTNDGFKISLDDNPYFEEWKNLTSVDITNVFIMLKSDNENYLFPKKSMETEEYIFFCNFLKEKTSIYKVYNNEGIQEKHLITSYTISALKPASNNIEHLGLRSSKDPVFTVHFPL